MKIEIEHVCRNIYSYGGTEVWAWLRKLVLVYETDTGERIRLRGRKFSYEGENTVWREKNLLRGRKYGKEGEIMVTREKIRFFDGENTLSREKIRLRGKNTLAMERTDLPSKKRGYVGGNAHSEEGTLI